MVSNDAVPRGLEPWLLSYVAEQAQPAQVDAWVERVTGAILTEMPEVRQVEGLEDLLRVTVREHWVAFLAAFAQPAQHFHLVAAAQRLSGMVAQLQVPLETLIQFYRVGQQEVWAYVSEVIKELPPSDFDRADLLLYFWNRAGVWLDKSIGASIEIYQAERAKVVAGVDARRYETVQAVLAGQMDDVRRISSALGGYPISAHHTAMVLACDDDDAIARLEQVALDLARSVGSGNPLLVRPGGRRLWVWIATRDAIGTDTLVETFHSGDRGATVVGVGTPSHGVRGFAESHAEALGALQVIGDRSAAHINVYADVELLVLLGCSPGVDRFVARILGDLAGEEESAQRIRETLDAYLASGGNVDESSRQLMVHRNTIRYRLGQAEELLGRPIGKISTEVSLALRHLSAFHPDGSLGQ
ncbi:MAG TPA: helix-turn-helix domain-containing protein [Nocardioides sp.]|nr:helix-turn-helix domain-containing protein [Nocardioides sp.]